VVIVVLSALIVALGVLLLQLLIRLRSAVEACHADVQRIRATVEALNVRPQKAARDGTPAVIDYSLPLDVVAEREQRRIELEAGRLKG